MRINKKQLLILFVVGLFFFAFLIRLVPIRIAHFWDETVYLQHAEIIFSGRTNFDELSFRPPLLPILFSFVFLIKHSVVSASILTAFLGALVPLFAYLIGKKVYDHNTGIIAGLLLIPLPFLTFNSNYLLTDVPVISLLAVSFYLLLFREKKFLFFSGVFFSLAILMKFTAILMAVIFGFYFFIYKFKFKEIFVFGLGALIIILPYLIWNHIKFGNFLTPFIKGQLLVSDKNEDILFYFANIDKIFGLVIIIGFVFGLINFFRDIKNHKLNKIDLFFIFWIFLFMVYLTAILHKELRYLLIITIPFVLLASKGIWSFSSKLDKYKIWFWVLFVLYLFFLISHTYAWESLNQGIIVDWTQSDEMKIADYLKDINYHGIIYSNQRWPVFAYYTGLEVRLLWPQDEEIYSKIDELMTDPGMIIGMFDVKEPQPQQLDKDKRFSNYKKMGDFFIYEYSPSMNFTFKNL